MANRLFSTRPITVCPVLMKENHLTFDAAAIADFIAMAGPSIKRSVTAAEISFNLNIPKSRTGEALKLLRSLGFADWKKGEGTWVTQSYWDTFVLQIVDPARKLDEMATEFKEYLCQVNGKPFRGGIKIEKEKIADILKKKPDLTVKQLKRVIFWCDAEEYTDPKQKKFLRASTLLNGKFFERLDNADAYFSDQRDPRLFTENSK